MFLDLIIYLFIIFCKIINYASAGNTPSKKYIEKRKGN